MFRSGMQLASVEQYQMGGISTRCRRLREAFWRLTSALTNGAAARHLSEKSTGNRMLLNIITILLIACIDPDRNYGKQRNIGDYGCAPHAAAAPCSAKR